MNPSRANMTSITDLVSRSSRGQAGETDKLFTLMYEDLCRLAGRFLQNEPMRHRLSSSSLVHQAYVRMIDATDHDFAPWYRVHADDKRRARLNCIAHLLSMIPYEKLPFTPPDPGKRKKRPPGTPETLTFTHEVPQRY